MAEHDEGAVPGAGLHGRIAVTVDSDLADLIPGFLENRRRDVETLRVSLRDGDWDTVTMLGHRMKGAGGGYGFDGISHIGAGIERAGTTRDEAGASGLVDELEHYLGRVDLVFEDF